MGSTKCQGDRLWHSSRASASSRFLHWPRRVPDHLGSSTPSPFEKPCVGSASRTGHACSTPSSWTPRVSEQSSANLMGQMHRWQWVEVTSGRPADCLGLKPALPLGTYVWPQQVTCSVGLSLLLSQGGNRSASLSVVKINEQIHAECPLVQSKDIKSLLFLLPFPALARRTSVTLRPRSIRDRVRTLWPLGAIPESISHPFRLGLALQMPLLGCLRLQVSSSVAPHSCRSAVIILVGPGMLVMSSETG